MALGLTILLAPLVMLFVWPQGLYPAAGQIDGWLYIGWARHFDYYSTQWHDTYYFVRFGWTVPGALLFGLLPDPLAKHVWSLLFMYVYIACMAFIARRAFGTASAFLVIGLIVLDPRNLYSFAWGYVDGPGHTYTAMGIAAALAGGIYIRRSTRRAKVVSALLFGVAGACLTTLAFLHLSLIVFGLPPALLALEAARRDLRSLALIAGAFALGMTLSFIAHAVIYHHYAGSWEVWSPIKAFLDSGGTQDSISFSKYIRTTFGTYTGGLYQIPLLIAISGSCIALLHSAIFHSGRIYEVITQISVVTVYSLFLIMQANHQSTLNQPFHEQFLSPVIILTLASLISCISRATTISKWILTWSLICPALLLWPRHILGHHIVSSPARFDLVDRPALSAVVGTIILSILVAVVSISSIRVTRYLRYTILLPVGIYAGIFWAYQIEFGWLQTPWKDASFVHWYERSDLFYKEEKFRDFYIMSQDIVDEYIPENPNDPPTQFISDVYSVEQSAWLSHAVNSTLMYQYTQLTPGWPEFDCQYIQGRLSASTAVVAMGETWPYDSSSFDRLQACGGVLTYSTHAHLQRGSWGIDIVEYVLPVANEPADVSVAEWIHANRGSVSFANGRTLIKTDDRPYGYSAVVRLHAGAAAQGRPGILEVVARSHGAAGLVVVSAISDRQVLGQVKVDSESFRAYHIPVADLSAASLLIVRNYDEPGVRDMEIASVKVFDVPTSWRPIGHVARSGWTRIPTPERAHETIWELDLLTAPLSQNASAAALDIQSPIPLQVEIIAADGHILASATTDPRSTRSLRLELFESGSAATVKVRGPVEEWREVRLGELLWLAKEPLPD